MASKKESLRSHVYQPLASSRPTIICDLKHFLFYCPCVVISTTEWKKALSRREQRRRGYLGASSEEGAISARAARRRYLGAKKALSRRQLRKRRYLCCRDSAFFLSAVDILFVLDGAGKRQLRFAQEGPEGRKYRSRLIVIRK